MLVIRQSSCQRDGQPPRVERVPYPFTAPPTPHPPPQATPLEDIQRGDVLATVARWHKQDKHQLAHFVATLQMPEVERDRLLQYIDQSALPPTLLPNRQRIVKLPAPADRCVARLESGAQCYKPRVASSTCCGTHRDFLPFGTVDASLPTKTAMHVQNHLGISLMVDAHRGVVYNARDVLMQLPAPRTVGTYCFVEHAAQKEEVFPFVIAPESDDDE